MDITLVIILAGFRHSRIIQTGKSTNNIENASRERMGQKEINHNILKFSNSETIRDSSVGTKLVMYNNEP